jgi:predicted nucleic acid-binding protein
MTADASSFVIDASIALSWCFEDESSPATDAVLERLRRGAALAPVIWPLEVANGLRSAERRGRIDEGSIPAVTQLLLSLPIRVDDHVRLDDALGRVLHMARSVGPTAYDAAYLDLATRRGLPLATADEQLARAAIAVGIQLLEAPR